MKTAYRCFEKGHGTHTHTHKKKIYIYIYIYIFKNKIETNVPNKFFFYGGHEFCFTNMKIVL
jgi:hypothetical protein